jgi:hypothetical protein
LYETYVEGDDAEMRRRHLEVELRAEAASMFKTYWRYSSADQQVLLAVMALRMLARGRPAVRGDIVALLKHFYRGAERTILSLEKRGLVLDSEAEPRPYRLFAWSLGEWIADELLARTGDAAIWSAWQHEHGEQMGKLTPDMRRRLSGLFPRLNASLTDTLGEWLLNPRTVSQSLSLLEEFLRHYKQPIQDRPPLVGEPGSAGEVIPLDLHMQHLAHELAAYSRILDRWQIRAARHNPAEIPEELQLRIAETEARIAEIKSQLRALGEQDE